MAVLNTYRAVRMCAPQGRRGCDASGIDDTAGPDRRPEAHGTGEPVRPLPESGPSSPRTLDLPAPAAGAPTRVRRAGRAPRATAPSTTEAAWPPMRPIDADHTTGPTGPTGPTARRRRA
ncbi:hypothetical protein HNR23_000233 [Nocardiopsis mwathae]|uniref:Uncharacterized protein n=1 Tax=Nocardiopsis mwathae TaxID=1472723 RepID=A0A7W9YDL0_9ACTN|nr:hypothetical protein [Nocardiopsis mwathae]MBB6170173.1 hypothetical protein [Nocardiopsis mwathae]